MQANILNTEQIDRLNDEAWKINRTNPAEGLLLADDALKRSKEINYKKGTAYALAVKGACNIWPGNYEESLQLSLEAQVLLQELNDKEKEADVLYNIFCVFYFLADYNNALKYAYDNYNLASHMNNAAKKAAALNAIGTIQYTLGENEKAIETLNKAMHIAEQCQDENLLVRILDGLGTANYNTGNYQKTVEYNNRCVSIAGKLGIKQVVSYALDGLGKAYKALNDYEKAQHYYLQSLQIRREMDFKAGESESLLHIGELYLENNQPEKAKDNLIKALSLAEEIGSYDICYQTHLALSNFYEKQKDYDKFIHHYKKYYEYKDNYFGQKQQQKIKSQEMQLRMEQIEKEKELLTTKNKELENYYTDILKLSEIGKKIISSLSVEKINRIVFDSLKGILAAEGFGIGIYNEQENALVFPGYIENGEVLSGSKYDLTDNTRLACICFNNDQEILINNFDKEIYNYVKKYKPPIVGKTVAALIYLPLKVKDKKIGVITAQSFTINAYSDYHLNYLKNLANYASIALENATLYEKMESLVEERTSVVLKQKEEIEKNIENTRLLSEIGQQLTSNVRLKDIFYKLYENVNKLMPAECFGVRIYHPDKDCIEYKFEIEKDKIYEEPIFVPMSNEDNYSVWCVKNKQVIFLNDNLNEYHKYTKKIVVPSGEMPHSLIFYPMMIGQKVLGVITVQSFKKFAYTSYHIDILKTLGSYTAIALENANLVENLEEKVAERTREVVKQKEEIEKTYQNTKLLSEIGKEISSLLSVEEIIQRAYNNVNTLMDAATFGIAIHRQEHNDLYFEGAMEKGIKLNSFSFSLNDDKIATRCFLNRQEIIINNWEKEYNKYIQKDYTAQAGEMPESMIYLPLITKNKCIGVITVQSFQKNAYNEYHLNIIRNLSLYIASALENASLYEKMEELVAERTAEIEKAYLNTRLLSQIGKDITSCLTIETIVEKVYENVNNLMDATMFGIGIYDETSRSILMPGFIENGIRMEDFAYNIDDERLAVICFKNQQELFINNYFEEYSKYIKGIKKAVSGKDSTSIIYLPVYNKEKTIGVITVQSYQPNAYTEYHLDILRNLSVSVGIALENAKLYLNLEEKVRERTIEVVKQKEIIEEKNKHITDSIIYAKRIQQAILPPEETLTSYLKNAFVLYKPKDIVSGDFYWIERKENKILFAVVDCTGHGVPGAFMSIIGFNGLNQIVNEYNITQPAEILNHLNKIITNTLKQRAEESKIRDGMDISVCSIDMQTNTLQYAGANNPIFIVRNNEVLEIKADKQPIGNFVGENEFRFTNKEIPLQPNDNLYLFSDGYADQFGGPKGKKLKYSSFRKLLLENHKKPMQVQKQMLDFMFEEWRGELEQIDDVCVIGVKI